MNIINLPTDMIGEIFSFTNKEWLYLTCKRYWIRYFNKKTEMSLKNQRSYYRFLIRHNMFFIFNLYFNELIKTYNEVDSSKYNKKFKYKNLIFSNLIDEIKYFCQDYRVKNKCYSIILTKKIKKKQKGKYKFKKTKKRNIEWTN